MEKIPVSNGVYWLEIPEADLRILCGCPADSVKHLMNKGLIVSEEKEGVLCETGPNAILLSESFLQNGHFSNLSEFPILQMLYRQGFILPNHPNNTGIKPMLIGRKESIEAQSEYIYRGNYGLTSIEEMLDAGVSEKQAHEIMRFKKKFAFDQIRSTDELIDSCIVSETPKEIKNGVSIRRMSFNVYEFTYKNKKVTVDINLEKGVEYEPPYKLSHYQVAKEYFSVVHSGEGDGWDKHRPCMASILTFQGKIYLVDAGPNLLHSLRALGIGVTKIEGVFLTHSHDDHFNGLTALMASDHKIKFYASPLVRAATVKKFCSLLSLQESQFSQFFDINDLKDEEWNDIDGLEVKPSISPHPVETSILSFRTLWGEGYKTYSHLADVASFSVLEGMLEEDTSKSGLTKSYFNKVKENYLTPATIKKVDIGGGLIHGVAMDFAEDTSNKLLLSHTAKPLTEKEREIGSNASFGVCDVLIPSSQDYSKQKAYQHLKEYFPTAPAHDLRMLLNCEVVEHNPGSILLKKGQVNESIYFVLSGITEFISSEFQVRNKLSVGSLAGELSGIQCREVKGTHRALSHIKAIKIPRNLYIEFLKKNNIFEDAMSNLAKRQFLTMTWLIGEQVSCPLKNKIARSMKTIQVPAGWQLPKGEKENLYMLESGEIELSTQNTAVSQIKYGSFFAEENVIQDFKIRLSANATKDSILWQIPTSSFDGIPIIHWKLVEAHEKRMKRVSELTKG